MLEILHAIGPDNWLSRGDFSARREAIQDLFLTHPVRDEETDQDWPKARQLHAELVVVDGDELVGTAMLVRDLDRPDNIAQIWGMGFAPEHRTEFAIHALEEALIVEAALEDDVHFIQTTDGRFVPNPYVLDAGFEMDPQLPAV